MKVAVNLHCLHPPLTGIGHYARHLLQEMLEDSRVESVMGLSHAGWHSQQEVQAIVANARGYEQDSHTENTPTAGAVNKLLGLPRRVLRRVPGIGRLRAKLNYTMQQRRTRASSDYLYWEPNYLLLPVANSALATVHDISHLRHPEFHPQQRLRELERLPQSLARAQRIITVSEFTRTEVAAAFDIAADRISVVSPSVSSRFQPAAASALDSLRDEYALPDNYILCAGTIEPRKNVPALLEAFSALPQELQAAYPLVLVGGRGWHPQEYESTLARLNNPNIRELGYVRFEDLPALYAGAAIFTYPSLYEGFGMPILEAMASGTPVITSSMASMPEVASGAAVLVDPRSKSELVAAMQELLENAGRREQLRAQGLAVAASHSWAISYQNLFNALASVSPGGSS